jgi:segregation and condensation protein B
MSIERKVVRKLTRAAIETLAIIAYHQPVTRAEIEEIRGVAISKGTLDSLLEADWIKPAGRRETPGRPVTWATTTGFLEHFNLESCAALPGIEELRAAGLLDARSAVSTLGTQGSTVLPPDGAQERAEEEAAAIELRGEPEATVDTEAGEEVAEDRVADDAYEAELLARAEEEEPSGAFAPAEEHEEAVDPVGEDDEDDAGDEDDDDADEDDGDEDDEDGDDESEDDDDADDDDFDDDDDSDPDDGSGEDDGEGEKKSGHG